MQRAFLPEVLLTINTDEIRSVLFGLDRKPKIYFARLLIRIYPENKELVKQADSRPRCTLNLMREARPCERLFNGGVYFSDNF
jgi:hypothetical protein